jgi:hypothetical protein
LKKNRGEETTGVIIHIYMEMSQGNYLCSYFISNKQKKCHLFSFFLLQTWRTGGWAGGRELEPVGGGRWRGKGMEDEYGANTVYTCV